MSESEISTGSNIYIVGFMGVGKSTIGRRVARSLDMKFIDSDKAVEEKAGKSVREMFEQDGEELFRSLEREFFESGHPSSGCVVACGGGVLVSEGMLDILSKRGMIIGLFAKPESILARTQHRSTRPLLNVEDKEAKIRELLEQREKTYLKADTLIMTDGRKMSEVAFHIVRAYKQKAAKSKAP